MLYQWVRMLISMELALGHSILSQVDLLPYTGMSLTDIIPFWLVTSRQKKKSHKHISQLSGIQHAQRDILPSKWERREALCWGLRNRGKKRGGDKRKGRNKKGKQAIERTGWEADTSFIVFLALKGSCLFITESWRCVFAVVVCFYRN